MAEVRQIPSAVGAFEAQVIDFNKTYNAIVQNAASARRMRLQAQNDIEKRIDVSLADKRTIRPQDGDYIEEKRQEVYNYYFQNRDNILAGGKAAGELKMKMGEFTSAVNQSSSLNKRGMSLNPAWKEAMKDQNQMDESLVETQRLWSLPINDPKRKEAKFMRGDVEASIDEFDVPDISYSKKFDEIKDIYEPVTKNVKPYTVETMRLTTNKKLGIYVDKTTKLQLYNPTEIVNTVTAAVSGSKSRGFLSDYGKQLAVYKSMPQEDKDLELKGVIEAYKDLEGTDMSSWFAKQGGTAGIDNELELAAFKQLQNNLPQLVKDTYDYRTQGILIKQWQYELGRLRLSFGRQKEVEAEGFDASLTKAIKSGKFNPDEWNAYMNGWSNIDHPGASGVRAGGYNFSKPDASGKVSVTYYAQVPLQGEDGKPLTSIDLNEAQALAMMKSNPKLRQASKSKVMLSRDGIWYAQMERSAILDPKSANLAPDVSNMNSYVQEAIPIAQAKEEFEEGRKSKKGTESKQFIPGRNTKKQ